MAEPAGFGFGPAIASGHEVDRFSRSETYAAERSRHVGTAVEGRGSTRDNQVRGEGERVNERQGMGNKTKTLRKRKDLHSILVEENYNAAGQLANRHRLTQPGVDLVLVPLPSALSRR